MGHPIRMNNTDKKLVKEMVNIWISTHHTEMEELREEIAFIQSDLKNKFASTDDKSIRHLAQMPTDLSIKLKNNFPELFKDHNMRWFVQEFKEFLVADKI